MSHDMSIHVYEVGDTLSADNFLRYTHQWGCMTMQHVGVEVKGVKGAAFTCMKEVGGYSEDWEASVIEDGGRITELVRRA